ncbi:YqeG family HAD IIIA-type phosphatase [Sporosarcina cyprini]|uniref:YqeG family HAD IIIA-type phosphatase n=1 Tax=Sporosarcina cyprini TaxID=2910523 RepID=UPI001EDFD8B9|nr:YqeG family HAD IIIA-type phosphatase [Sporosarcina cyprini]MCG3089195.1 YqeG family HAD IIIA-type phosphatase [Sporosarcina cyprini]
MQKGWICYNHFEIVRWSGYFLYKQFLPGEYVKDIYQIRPDTLIAQGIKGIMTDLDNTLVEWDRPEATPEVIEWMKMMRDAGLKVVVVSNNHEPRVSTFCQPAGIPFIFEAKKPLGKGFSKALRLMGLPKEEVVMIGDQLLTDILGGNRFGVRTILVIPVAKSDGFVTRFNRKVERRIMKGLKRRGMLDWEE